MIDAPVLTVRQHTLVRTALHVVDRAAAQVAKRFDRFVKAEDLLAVGTIELYEAARAFDESYNHAFADYAFMAGVEEAQRSTAETEAAEQQEYTIAVGALRAALAKLSEPDRRILAALYRDLMDSREASKAMSIPYSSFRRRHAAALERLRKELMAEGVKRAPRPRFVPDPGSVLGLPRGAPGNDGDPPP